MNQQVITNARVILEDEIILGTVVVEFGQIRKIDQGVSQLPNASDWEGDYLMPGMIELHTDNMEKYFAPRPGVSWPGVSAMIAHDTQMAASGITTVFDAVSVGYDVYKSKRSEMLSDIIDALQYIKNNQISRAEHFLHLRCELSCDVTAQEFDRYARHPLLRLVSLMDHSPGQRQFARIEKYIEYYQTKYGFSDEAMKESIEQHQLASQNWSRKHREYIAGNCNERDIPLASHDDASIDHVTEALRHQVSIAEFPTTMEAAEHSHHSCLKVLMGAPNLIRGHSHSGNVAARELAEQGYLDILSSDYYPASLLQSAFLLHQLDIGYDLPRAIRCVTGNPASAAGLDDRGVIAEGKKADLLRVAMHDDLALLKQTWQHGVRVN